MKVKEIVGGVVVAVILVGVSTLLVPVVFAGRVLPLVTLDGQSLTGMPFASVESVLTTYESDLGKRKVTLALRGVETQVSLEEIGVSVDKVATMRQMRSLAGGEVVPEVSVDQARLHEVVQAHFAEVVTLPVNAGLQLTPSGILVSTPSKAGEGVDLVTLGVDVRSKQRTGTWHEPLELQVVQQAPTVHDGEVAFAQQYAERLLREGFSMTFGGEQWEVKPYTLRRLIEFVPVVDNEIADNMVLGVSFNEEALQNYLELTLVPEINQPAINARFERQGDRVTQFAVPQEGLSLEVAKTIVAIQDAVRAGELGASLAVVVTEPVVRSTDDLDALGIETRIATGVSDFAGSPPNRVHNIRVGTQRYHGLLIEPGADFSFNEFLGPVDAAHGFKPELVIKSNVTVPEYGGGLCQVSSTVFRAALNAGLEITQRRNHAYAVSYYGTPGLDATIYPPYTDLRFKNNTPGYLLVQTRIEGTRLLFDIWGTDDGREVVVSEPYVYDRQPNGAVKASVTQTVVRDDEVLVDDAFYSRYQSPDLFPKQSDLTNDAAEDSPAPL